MLQSFIEEFLRDHYFNISTLHLFLILILFFLNFSSIQKKFNRIKKKTWISLLIIVIFGLFVRLWLSPAGDPIYAGWESKMAAKYFFLDHKHHFCLVGNYEYCEKYEFQRIERPGLPYLLALSFLFFGISNETVFYISILFGILTVLGIFLLSYVLFKKENPALFSALLLSVLPLHIFFSSFCDESNVALFFSILTILIFLISLEINTIQLYSLSFLFLVYSMAVRVENIVLLVVFAFCFLIYKKKKLRNLQEFIYKKLSVPLILFFVFGFLPWSYWFIFSYELGLAGEISFGLTYFWDNFLFLIRHWSGYIQYFLGLLFLFFLGLSWLYFHKYNQQIFLLGIWFVAFNLLYLSYNGPHQLRYILMTYPPIVLLFGVGVQAFIEKLKIKGRLLPLLIAILIVFSSGIPGGILKNERIDYGWSYEIVDDTRKAARRLNESDYIVTTNKEFYVLQFMTSNNGIMLGELNVRRFSLLSKKHKIYFFKSLWYDHTPEGGVEEDYKLKFLFKEGSVEVYEVMGWKGND